MQMIASLLIMTLLVVSQTNPPKETPVSETELAAVHKLFKGIQYEGAGSGEITEGPYGETGIGYVIARRDISKPRVVIQTHKTEYSHDKLSCRPYAYAVLHRLLRESFAIKDYSPQHAFGGARIAAHYGLKSSGFWTVADFMTAVKEQKIASGVYFFDLRTASGWKDGRKTKYKKGMHAHVGFIVVDASTVRQYQFSKKYDGPSGDQSFIEDYLPWSRYGKDDARKSCKIEIYRVTKPK